MRIAIEDADALVSGALQRAGFAPDEARIITDQIIGCELRGVGFAGLSRALSMIERLQSGPKPEPMRVVRETVGSALIDGGDTCGYLVAQRAVEIGIAKAKAAGVAVIGAKRTYYTGMYAHYLEQATRSDLVAMAVGSSAPRVAPHGAREGRFGTNPIAFAFPSNDDPIIFDAATSGIPIAEAVLSSRLKRPLQNGFAFDADGEETTDPLAALQGALTVWGGHRGSGLGIVVQLLGMMVGGGAMPEDYRDCGFLFLAIRPDLFTPTEEFKTSVSHYAASVRAARPVDSSSPVRMPFDRSAETRRRILREGAFDVSEGIVEALRAVRGRGAP